MVKILFFIIIATVTLQAQMPLNKFDNLLCSKVSEWKPLEEVIDTLLSGSSEMSVDTIEISLDNSELFFGIRGERLNYPTSIYKFYETRACRGVWFSTETGLTNADTLIEKLQHVDFEGFNPKDYHLNKLLDYYQKINYNLQVNNKIKDTLLVVDFEILMTDAAISYAKDLRLGKINPHKIEQHYEVERDTAFVADDLAFAVNQNRITDYYLNIAPHYNQYERLKCILAEYLEKEPWDSIKCDSTLKVGMKSSFVKSVRERLGHENSTFNDIELDTVYYTSSSEEIDSFQVVAGDSIFNQYMYDSLLLETVLKFQLQHGLETDGEIGKGTFAELNMPLSERVKQISINLERWRWMPRKIGDAYIIVNIAGYYLQYYDADTMSFTKKVVVGKPYTRTPVFSDQMRYIELNPYWTTPYSIASGEILPKLRRDPSYLDRNNMKLFRDGKHISPYSVDWYSVSRSNFPYVVRQEPGEDNALGLVKFMFPNRYNIYIHDTPSKSKFEEQNRTFSHGCVRLHEPMQMAEHILQGTKWTPDKIQNQIKKGKNKRIDLESPIPVFLMYWTVWVDDDGAPYFMQDVYKRDELINTTYFQE